MEQENQKRELAEKKNRLELEKRLLEVEKLVNKNLKKETSSHEQDDSDESESENPPETGEHLHGGLAGLGRYVISWLRPGKSENDTKTEDLEKRQAGLDEQERLEILTKKRTVKKNPLFLLNKYKTKTCRF